MHFSQKRRGKARQIFYDNDVQPSGLHRWEISVSLKIYSWPIGHRIGISHPKYLDIREYVEKYDCHNFVFKDSTFTANKKWADALMVITKPPMMNT